MSPAAKTKPDGVKPPGTRPAGGKPPGPDPAVPGPAVPGPAALRVSWPGVIRQYAARLPVPGGAPVITLGEGATPLLPAPELSARTGCEVYLKVEGANPTGSFKDRGMTVAVTMAAAHGASAVICASTGNTSASAAAYAARAGLTCAVLVPRGKIALGKLAQALVHGARLLQVDGNFDDCLELARKLAADYPVALVNSVNPDRLAGQKTAAFEIVEALGDAPDVHCLPVGNAGNISAYWMGYREYRDAGLATRAPRMFGFQASGAAPIVRGEPVLAPQTIATAIRIGNPASWRLAEEARDASGGVIHSVTDRQILAAYRLLAGREAVFGELASAAGVAGLLQAREQGLVEPGARVVCTITGNGLKDPDWAVSAAPAPVTIQPDPSAAADALGLGLSVAWCEQVPGHGTAGAARPVPSPRPPGADELSWPEQPAAVHVPATSANLGPGFDALGLALTLHDVIEARVTGSGLSIEVSGEGAGTADVGERHLVVQAMRAAFGVLGGQPPGLALRCSNAIPHGRGLGSSAAAIVSGLLAARALVRDGPERLPDAEVFRLAVELEGHPDNVAACLAGGLTIAWTVNPPGPGAARPAAETAGAAAPGAGVPADGGAARGSPAGPPGPRLLALPVAGGLRPVVCVPPGSLSTVKARRALPPTVPHADAAANAGRSALLIAALTRDPGVLFDATEDYLHQRYRAAVMPGTADLVTRLRAAGVAAVVSGAGPSVLALTVSSRADEPGAVDSIARETGIGWHVIPLDIDRYGATVQPAWPGAQLPDGARHVRSWNPPGAGSARASSGNVPRRTMQPLP